VPQFAAFDGQMVMVTTRLLHEGGASVTSTLAMRPTKNDPQGVGSAITYARRYSLLAMTGAAPEDDDGNAASRPARDYSPVAFLTAQPGTVVESAYNVFPLRSGVYSVGPFYLYGGDPFGFYKCWRRAAGDSTLTVLPSPVVFRLPRQRSRAAHRENHPVHASAS
jgi:hypothetical protein